ncbi:hypothetical protein C8A00DRAFT_17342 [Chaetomidium leptoderma]|uniref:C2H2-type domain-containing protein n=1 Tax=Chaetomidium leptoderma TaxID=669021 RepID=A0AAN6ZWB5_9PEZI|nr:hypothetical protein C8A00DRAFT_17342 [Chaetomidium leptoderma]
MQASAGRSHVNHNARRSISRRSPLYLFESSPQSSSPPCYSSVPSTVSTPRTCTFGPLSPHGHQSTAQTSPTPTGTFCHSRDSTLVLDLGPPVHEVGALGALLKTVSISPIPGRQHRPGSASLDMSKLHRHRRINSEDLSRCCYDASQTSDFGCVAEDQNEDEDLRIYRQEIGVTAPDMVDASTHKTGAASIITDIEDDDLTTSFSEVDDTPELDTDGDSTLQADRVAKELLGKEFGLFLGSSEPPQEVIKAVCKCLDEISLSVRAARSMGVLPTRSTAAPETETAGPVSFGSSSKGKARRSGDNQKKRPMRDQGDDEDDDVEDDEGKDGRGITDRNDVGHRKRPKVEQYPCPFRKRTPHRFNCRDWEFCAKAPFKTMTELKKHIIKYHQQQHEPLAYVCLRCHAGFVRQEEWQSHMLVPPAEMCDVKRGPRPPTEIVGITSTMMERLRSRSQHFNWDTLWRALFPDDPSVPNPDFEPVVELHEVEHEYRGLFPEFQTRLLSIIETLRPGMDEAHLRRLQVLNGNLENLFQEFVATTFDRARTHAAETSPNPQALRTATDTLSPAPSAPSPREASIPNSRPSSSLSRAIINPRAILPNPAHRLSDWSSTGTSPSSARYSTSTTTSFAPSNRESLVSTISSQGSPSNIPPPSALPIYHQPNHNTSSFHPRMPLRAHVSSSSTSTSTRSPLRELSPTTSQPLQRDLALLMTEPTHKRHQKLRQEEETRVAAAGTTKQRDPRDSAVCDMDMSFCFKCVGDNIPCRCESDGELPPPPPLSLSGAGVYYGQEDDGYFYGLQGSTTWQPDGEGDMYYGVGADL